MILLQKLAETLRDLAETGTDAEVARALELCVGFADRVDCERPHDFKPEVEVSQAVRRLMDRLRQISGDFGPN